MPARSGRRPPPPSARSWPARHRWWWGRWSWLLLLDVGLEAGEGIGPQAAEPLVHGGQRLAAGAVDALGAHPTLAQEAGFAQHGEVLRDGRPADVGERRRDLAGGKVA